MSQMYVILLVLFLLVWRGKCNIAQNTFQQNNYSSKANIGEGNKISCSKGNFEEKFVG